MICRLKLVYEDDYLLGLQKRAVDNDHTSVWMWLPGSQSPSSRLPLLYLHAPAFAPAFVHLAQRTTARGQADLNLSLRQKNPPGLRGPAPGLGRNSPWHNRKWKARAQQPGLPPLTHPT